LKSTQKTTFQAKHTSKKDDHSEAAVEAADEDSAVAEDTADETDAAVAAAVTVADETDAAVAAAVAAVTGQDTKLPKC
jgi:hypothetical protein